MRLSRLLSVFSVPLSLVACDQLTGLTISADAPANIAYQLVPSGDPANPLGVLLSWDVPASGRANSFNVYGRSNTAGAWQLRATTTSPTFHDAGVPEAQYYVATRDADGNELAQSPIITIDVNASRLPAPLGLSSISLNGAVQLAWRSNAVDASHGTFDYYRVYSTSYDAARGVCTANWVVEGSTVSDAFYAGNLTNGVSRCYSVTAISRDGHESDWSQSRLDTPRNDAHNAFVYSTGARSDSSGFLFFEDATKKLGVVGSSARADLDFTIERHQDGSLWFAPARPGVTMELYSTQPVGDLTSIDRAPATGFGSVTIEAVPGFAYVFRIVRADGVHFAGIRVAFRTSDYVVFDWSYQTAPGNAELNRSPRA
jgi:hypothetical protein